MYFYVFSLLGNASLSCFSGAKWGFSGSKPGDIPISRLYHDYMMAIRR